ncbi:glycosyltransferase family 9 protein [Pararoseomonas indoligenes]|uniref:Tetratricopeptide repeat protein n=1 Tax=Roseomonas indoligenes TaxID=2820811 RepID=A0A940S689_9PROT|nr:glycosyltransferase family 9 protein [Pararoseomonas indoligenes]MBP0495266.1 tetratricopeptide repeat protein [Pararoseomonas indoligenes]
MTVVENEREHAGTDMVHAAFALLLGRSASPAATVAEMARMSPVALLQRLTSSKEFFQNVVLRLAGSEALPHERRQASPQSPLVDWIVDLAKPEAAAAARAARTWRDLLLLLLRDPAAGPTILSPAHRPEILRALEPVLGPERAMQENKPAATLLPDPAYATPAVAAEVLGQLLQTLPAAELGEFWTKLEENILGKRVRQLFREKQWADLNALHKAGEAARKKRAEIQTMIGRSHIYAGEYDTAARLLSSLATEFESDATIQFYSSVALARNNELEKSVGFGRRAIALRPKNDQFLADQSAVLRQLARQKTTDQASRTALLEESIDACRMAIQVNPNRAENLGFRIARNFFDLRRFPEALAATDKLLKLKPDGVPSLMLRSDILLALNRPADALAIARRVLEIEPGHQGAQYQLRSLRTLIDDDEDRTGGESLALLTILPQADTVTGSIFSVVDGQLLETALPETPPAVDSLQLLSSLPAEWVIPLPAGRAPPVISAAWMAKLHENGLRWSGRVLMADEAGAPLEIWRRDLITLLIESGLLRGLAELPGDLAEHAAMVATIDLSGSLVSSHAPGWRGRRTVVLMSKHGVVKFGGGEQFLDSMAEHYAEMGFDPVIVGTRADMVGQSGVENGRAFHFVEETAAAMRQFFLEVKPAIVHVLSGLGYQVADALEYLDVPFVYGVHFWRDCLGLIEGDNQFFLNFDRDPVPRPAFRRILQRAATVYSNSSYTQAVLEEAFHARTPIIYSLPRDVDPSVQAEREREAQDLLGDRRDFVLLVNAKGEKGFDLLLATARLCPDIPFVAISSQSDQSEAEAAVADAGAGNVAILPRTDRIDLLYSRSKVVAVPSYHFVETFSRVCIEAQRFGRPVLGSDRGNVPYLLQESGVVLPENADRWAAELRRIYDDPSYYRGLVTRAEQNSSRYSYDRQRRSLHGIISSLGDQILIGIGSGIGNMLHVAPMVRNIARRLGRKVDLVVAEDHKSSLFLLQNSDYVNAAFSLRQTVLRKRYDQVFITHSFGSARVPFLARRTQYSRDWMMFEPGGPFHETVFNLEAAKALLGVPYDDEDVTGYFVADYTYQKPLNGRRIGIHGGSKDGFWRSKRWPGYVDLARELQQHGYEVASFGVETERVPETLDLTGGTISEMIEGMMTCSYFISNDSGLMNIANALGIPLTALFGPTNPRTRGPLRPTSSWLGLTKDCSPCEIRPSHMKTFLSSECSCIQELDYRTVRDHVFAELRRHDLLLEAGGEGKVWPAMTFHDVQG